MHFFNTHSDVQVSDEKLGQMRLKFWHDAINMVYDKDKSKKLPEHPVIYEVNNVRFSRIQKTLIGV